MYAAHEPKHLPSYHIENMMFRPSPSILQVSEDGVGRAMEQLKERIKVCYEQWQQKLTRIRAEMAVEKHRGVVMHQEADGTPLSTTQTTIDEVAKTWESVQAEILGQISRVMWGESPPTSDIADVDFEMGRIFRICNLRKMDKGHKMEQILGQIIFEHGLDPIKNLTRLTKGENSAVDPLTLCHYIFDGALMALVVNFLDAIHPNPRRFWAAALCDVHDVSNGGMHGSPAFLDEMKKRIFKRKSNALHGARTTLKKHVKEFVQDHYIRDEKDTLGKFDYRGTFQCQEGLLKNLEDSQLHFDGMFLRGYVEIGAACRILEAVISGDREVAIGRLGEMQEGISSVCLLHFTGVCPDMCQYVFDRTDDRAGFLKRALENQNPPNIEEYLSVAWQSLHSGRNHETVIRELLKDGSPDNMRRVCDALFPSFFMSSALLEHYKRPIFHIRRGHDEEQCRRSFKATELVAAETRNALRKRLETAPLKFIVGPAHYQMHNIDDFLDAIRMEDKKELDPGFSLKLRKLLDDGTFTHLDKIALCDILNIWRKLPQDSMTQERQHSISAKLSRKNEYGLAQLNVDNFLHCHNIVNGETHGLVQPQQLSALNFDDVVAAAEMKASKRHNVCLETGDFNRLHPRQKRKLESGILVDYFWDDPESREKELERRKEHKQEEDTKMGLARSPITLQKMQVLEDEAEENRRSFKFRNTENITDTLYDGEMLAMLNWEASKKFAVEFNREVVKQGDGWQGEVPKNANAITPPSMLLPEFLGKTAATVCKVAREVGKWDVLGCVLVVVPSFSLKKGSTVPDVRAHLITDIVTGPYRLMTRPLAVLDEHNKKEATRLVKQELWSEELIYDFIGTTYICEAIDHGDVVGVPFDLNRLDIPVFMETVAQWYVRKLNLTGEIKLPEEKLRPYKERAATLYQPLPRNFHSRRILDNYDGAVLGVYAPPEADMDDNDREQIRLRRQEAAQHENEGVKCIVRGGKWTKKHKAAKIDYMRLFVSEKKHEFINNLKLKTAWDFSVALYDGEEATQNHCRHMVDIYAFLIAEGAVLESPGDITGFTILNRRLFKNHYTPYIQSVMDKLALKNELHVFGRQIDYENVINAGENGFYLGARGH